MAAREMTMEGAAGAAAPAVLLGPQPLGTLIRNIVLIYRRHFRVLMACGALPILPFLMATTWLNTYGIVWAAVGQITFSIASFIAWGVQAVAISDMCVGNRPTVARAYSHALGRGRWRQLLSVAVLATVAIFGMLLLIVPGLWFLGRLYFVSEVVVLEGRRNTDAIRRSLALTKGQNWRLLGLTFLWMLIIFGAMLVVLLPLVVTLFWNGVDEIWLFVVDEIFNLVLAVLTPTVGIMAALLYYEQRALREAYDVQALSEDLSR